MADTTPEPRAIKTYDVTIIGSSIHINKYHSVVKHYIKQYVPDLNRMPGAFFSISLAVASDIEDEHTEVKKLTTDFLDYTRSKPLMTSQIAGALKYTEYEYFKRLIMKMISKKQGSATITSQDYEDTNWDEVIKFMNDSINRVSQKP
ncbi:flavodoxin domain-containing protein [Flavobacterium frigoris]|nr:flavodoxin domain-containing protein [Flavobacterium frigoris]